MIVARTVNGVKYNASHVSDLAFKRQSSVVFKVAKKAVRLLKDLNLRVKRVYSCCYAGIREDALSIVGIKSMVLENKLHILEYQVVALF